MSIGPSFSSGPQVCRFHSWEGSNFDSSVLSGVEARASEGNASKSAKASVRNRVTTVPREPKYEARLSASASVKASA